MNKTELKKLLFGSKYNDLFSAIESSLPDSDSTKNEYYSLKSEWKHPNNNFNEKQWKERMLSFLNELNTNEKLGKAENRVKNKTDDTKMEKANNEAKENVKILEQIVWIWLVPLIFSAVISILIFYASDSWAIIQGKKYGFEIRVSGSAALFVLLMYISHKQISNWYDKIKGKK